VKSDKYIADNGAAKKYRPDGQAGILIIVP